MRGVGDQAHGGAQDEGERPLAADQRPGHVEAALGQQVLQGVAGHLAPEPAELGADRAEVGVDEAAQPGEQDVRVRGVGPARGGPQAQPGAGAGHDVQRRRRCRRCARSRARGTRRRCCRSSRRWCTGWRARVGAEPQAVRPRPRLQRRLDDAGVDHRQARLGVDVVHAVQVAAGVHDDARARRRCRRWRCRLPGRSAGPRGSGTPRASPRSRPRAGVGRRRGAGRGRASRRRSRAPG